MSVTAAPPHWPRRAGLDSPVQAGGTLGANMGNSLVLDVIERLLRAARHPDITDIEHYGPGAGPWGPTKETSKVTELSGVKVTYQSTATASLWEAVWPDAIPVPAPDSLPPARRAPRLPIFVAQLLDYANPAQVQSWRLLAGPDLGLKDEQGVMPFGLGIVLADGTEHLLRSTSTGPTLGTEPSEEPYPDYVIPEGVRTCLQEANAVSAAPV